MPLIGEIGNLGSQIQQYFSMLSIAEVNKKKLVFPYSSLNKGYKFKFANLLEIPIYVIEDSYLGQFTPITINNFVTVDHNVFNLNPNTNYTFMARFDIYEYWYKTIKEKVDSTQFRANILTKAKNILSSIINSQKTISLHVRRGDYLLPQNAIYQTLNIEYYKKALSYYDLNDTQLVIFSNDIEWCQANLKNLHNNITYIDGNSDYIDLCLMSLCDHNIIANSSFSFWAAYFNKNPNKKIVCPKKYLLDQHELAPIINGNYYPDIWTAI
jgi:hypothetical protein